MSDSEPLLRVRGLVTRFSTEAGEIFPSNGVDLDIFRGEVVGLVGESGSGKSVTARALARLVSPPSAVISGTVHFRGLDLLSLPQKQLSALRGSEISIVVQDPAAALNPVMTVGEQILRIARAGTHNVSPAFSDSGRLGTAEARNVVIDLLMRLKIAEPERRLSAYPHQLSGGMKQRILIAMALVRRPSLLIADEPTTALDVTVAAEILELLDELRRDMGMAVLLISHDLSMISRYCGRVAVMYAGKIVEEGPTRAVLNQPQHPYTRGLLGSVPRGSKVDGLLPAIPGEPPNLARLPQGCAFQSRCPVAGEPCGMRQPLLALPMARSAACWRAVPESRP